MLSNLSKVTELENSLVGILTALLAIYQTVLRLA